MHQPYSMRAQAALTDIDPAFTASWQGIPIVDIRPEGLLSPIVGMLQRQTAIVIAGSLVIFHVGIGWIGWRLFHVLSPEVREAFLASSEVRSSEEHSDSIDQIAGAATSLSSAARRVAQRVGTFRLGDTPARGTPAVLMP
ncbi:MAG: hypothetical protein H0T48_02770 [Gemmatimonadaceae bacterium]|nr:hypothetical protein [Gemmatimonadaceae bacterium]